MYLLIPISLIYSNVPFHTQKDRAISDPLNANPGPGAYASKERKIVPKVHDKMHNSFTTKVSYRILNFLNVENNWLKPVKYLRFHI